MLGNIVKLSGVNAPIDIRLVTTLIQALLDENNLNFLSFPSASVKIPPDSYVSFKLRQVSTKIFRTSLIFFRIIITPRGF